MYRFFLSLTFILAAFPASWAEELKPPVPVNAGDGLDILPPPLDLDQMTPVVLPGAPSAASTGITPQAAALLKSLDEAASTSTKVPEKKTQKADPTATPTVFGAASAPTVETKKTEAPPSVQSKPIGLSAEYFPAAKGFQWSYEYLKQPPGEKAKKTKAVECLALEPSANGTINATFQVTEDGKSVQEKYSLSEDKVAHSASDSQTLADDFIFQLPVKGAVARWITGGNYFKAAFGKAEVYQKIYPDCVIVTEKTKSSTVISYYAKGIGLVAVEVYGKGLKLDQTKSTVLVSGPAAAAK